MSRYSVEATKDGKVWTNIYKDSKSFKNRSTAIKHQENFESAYHYESKIVEVEDNLMDAIFDMAQREMELEQLREENKKLKELAEMVKDNSKMPHQHSDYYLRLCCLSERAKEILDV